MKYEIIHSSEYNYTSFAALSLNEACLSSRSTKFQQVLSHNFQTEPKDDYHRDRRDFFGNDRRLFAFEKPHRRLEIISKHLVEVRCDDSWGDGNFGGFEPFLAPSPYVRLNQEFATYGRSSFPPGSEFIPGLLNLNHRIYTDFTYDPEATEITTTVEEFFSKRRGVCQDYAHFALAILRSLGIPARYVSGYLNTLPPPGKEKVLGADATHAWVSAYSPEYGWIDLDPTNGIGVKQDHITMAWGRDYGDVTPLKGVVLGGGLQKLEVKVSVIPIN